MRTRCLEVKPLHLGCGQERRPYGSIRQQSHVRTLHRQSDLGRTRRALSADPRLRNYLTDLQLDAEAALEDI